MAGNGQDKGNFLVKPTLSGIQHCPSPHIRILDLILITLVGFDCVVSLDAIMIGMTTRDSEMLSPTSVFGYLFHLFMCSLKGTGYHLGEN